MWVCCWIDCRGKYMERYFNNEREANRFANTLRPDMRGTVREYFEEDIDRE